MTRLRTSMFCYSEPGPASAIAGVAVSPLQTGVGQNDRTTGGNDSGGECATSQPHYPDHRCFTSTTFRCGYRLSGFSSSPAPVQLTRPEKFSGDSGDFRSFLIQCELHFELQPYIFQSERENIAYLISHLTGSAEAWAMAE